MPLGYIEISVYDHMRSLHHESYVRLNELPLYTFHFPFLSSTIAYKIDLDPKSEHEATQYTQI